MLHVIIKENSPQAKAFAEYVRTLPFVDIVEEKKKKKLLSEIEQSLKEVKLMKEGKLKKKSLKEMLDGE